MKFVSFRLGLTIGLAIVLALLVYFRPSSAIAGIFAGQRPTNLGVNAGQLAQCPSSPNCVSSQAIDESHQIAPFRLVAPADKVLADLKHLVQTTPRTDIVSNNDHYLYAEFTSRLMGFVDDVEFYLDPKAGVIQVRSASRLGESDLGVNRQRIETIRRQLRSLGDIS